MRIIIILAFIGIIFSLGSALVFLVRDRGITNRTVNALTVRVGRQWRSSSSSCSATDGLIERAVLAPHQSQKTAAPAGAAVSCIDAGYSQ
jgi:hypothetical protein